MIDESLAAPVYLTLIDNERYTHHSVIDHFLASDAHSTIEVMGDQREECNMSVWWLNLCFKIIHFYHKSLELLNWLLILFKSQSQ